MRSRSSIFPAAAIKTWKCSRAMSEASIPAVPVQMKTNLPADAKPLAPRSGRIARRFQELTNARQLGLVAYITAGDPSLDATEQIVLAAASAGADVIELGVPF